MNCKTFVGRSQEAKIKTVGLRSALSQCSVGGGVIQNGNSKPHLNLEAPLYFCISRNISDTLGVETTLIRQ